MSDKLRNPPAGAEATPRRFLLGGQAVEVARLAPGLHIVATPIGNLGDITLRALETLAGADVIACEDTRVTHKLLDRYGIARPLTPYHEHNAAKARPMLLRRLAEGAAIALVSDAGTPLISDPGYKLVRAAQDAGHPVTALPGASAVMAALAVAGLPTDQFLFVGFLPPKEAARRTRIAELARIPATLVLFETSPRVAATLADLAAGLGGQRRGCAYAANSPSCTRRSAAANLQRWPGATRKMYRAARSSSSLRRRRQASRLARPKRRRCCAKRWRAFRSKTPSAKSPMPPACRGARFISRRWRSRKKPRTRTMARRAEPLKPAKAAPRPERVAAFRLGLSAESRAAMFLIAKAYRIVARRWKTPFGEIDIVARRRRSLVFVEVKARANLDDAVEAVTERGKSRIVGAAEFWLAQHPNDVNAEIRFDVIVVAPGKIPRHIANAFDASR